MVRLGCWIATVVAASVAQAQVKISQLYGSGGNSTAPLLNDYIEIYNAGPAAQNLAGWSVQYMSATGAPSVANTTNLPAVVLAPGKYLLVQEANGGALPAGQTPALPAADMSGTIAMAATDFKIALVSSNVVLPTGTPTYAGNPTLVDFVGVGTANWNDSDAVSGAAHVAALNAPPASVAHALYRSSCGSTDTNSSRDDWGVGYPAPRNIGTPANLGLSSIGAALPLTVEPGQSVRLTATPFRCATSDLLAGTTVSINLAAIGGGTAVAMLDNATGGDEISNDGIYTRVTTIGAATPSASYSLPVTVTNGGTSGGTYINLFVSPATTPDNDNCYGAVAVATSSTTAGNWAGATVESNPFVTAGAAPTSGMAARRGLWYSVVGNGNTLSASLCNTSPVVDSVMMVMAGTCDGLTIIATGDDNGPTCLTTQASASWCSVLGTTYFVWVAPFASAAATAPFTLDILDGAACATGFPVSICTGVAGPYTEVEPGYGVHTNDGCASTPNRFTEISMPGANPTIIRGTARGMIGNRDVDAYRFQATTSGPITITIDTLGAQAQAQLSSLSAGGLCPATAIGNTPLSVTRCATGSQTLNSTVTAGTWYQILVVGGLGLQVTPQATVFGGQMPGGTTYQYTMSVSTGGPPVNDDCATASTVVVPSTTPGSTVNSTNDGTSSCDPTGRDVWYTFTLASSTTLVIHTGGSAIDTVVSLYGICGSAALSCNDDSPGCFATAPASRIGPVNLAAGTYHVRVSDKNIGAGGDFSLSIVTAVNDNCCGAVAVSVPSVTFGTTLGATLDTPVPPVCDGPGVADATGNTAITAPSVWFSVVSPVNQTVYADTVTASYDTKISVYTGTCGALTCVTMNDDILGNGHSKVGWHAVAGQQYLVMVHGFGTGSGTFSLNVTASPTPSNDLCSNAVLITNSAGSEAGTLVGATGDNSTITSDVLASCATDFTYFDVWYSWTAPCTGTANFDTCGSWDTVLSIHSVCPTPAAGNQVASVCNNDGPVSCTPGSSLLFSVTADTTYLVRVATAGAQASVAGGGQPFMLTWSIDAPSNDDCSGAVVVGSGRTTFDTHCATASTNPGCTLNEGVWFSYTTPASCGTVTITGPRVAAYAGSCMGVLEACGIGSITFPAQANTTFLVHVSWNTAGVEAQGTLTIAHVTGAAAINDGCGDALVIDTGLTYGTTTGATATTASVFAPPPCGASADSPDVWYSYTPPCDGTLTVDTCDLPCTGVRYDTVLSVYTGTCFGPLNLVGACSDEANCGTGYPSTSQVVVAVAGQTEHRIRVSGYSGASGDFALRLAFAAAVPPNDLICSALPIVPPCGTVAFSTCNSTTSATPGCAIFNDVWFQFTSPSCSGTITIATCNSLFDTAVAVYSGTCTAPVFLACNDNAPGNSACASTPQSSLTFSSLANTTYFVRVGAPSLGDTGNGVLTITCPATVGCPPAAGSATSAWFDVSGVATGTPWAFRMTIPCCMDVYVPNVPGVATSGTQSTDEANLRDAFVAAINLACSSMPAIATGYSHSSTVEPYGRFSIKARHCGQGVAATLLVGAAGTPPDQLCVVTQQALPVDGPCSFNPDIVAVALSGADCNGNGEDDYVDVISGTSVDLDGNGIPDECPIPIEQAGLAYCFGDALHPQPTTPCTCGNFGAPGNGCASSFNPAGANLAATGKPVFDDVVLTISGTNSSPGVVVFTANNAIDPNGLQFGDGITCGGGSLVRLRGVATSAGAASFPAPPETVTLSQRTLGSFGTAPGSGVSVSYSAFYRNAAAAFCPPFTFNAPNNYRITW